MDIEQYLSGRKEPYAWPGGYPKYLLLNDGGCLCMKCAVSEAKSITNDIARNVDTGWFPWAWAINWEDTELYCDHCNDKIECAYE